MLRTRFKEEIVPEFLPPSRSRKKQRLIIFPELRRILLSFYEQWRPNHVLVEDAASGQSLLQELRASTSLPIKAIKPDRDKVSRAQACTGMLEAGRVFLPEGTPWLNDYLDELSSFPSAPHDDMVCRHCSRRRRSLTVGRCLHPAADFRQINLFARSQLFASLVVFTS